MFRSEFTYWNRGGGLLMSYKSVLVLLLALLLCHVATADVTGAVKGTITDQSGAALSNATVTLTNTRTGLTHSAQSDASGQYEFLAVPVGEYRIDVEANGFQTKSQTGITLLVNQIFRSDFQLQVGSVHESVTTSAAALQVDT